MLKEKILLPNGCFNSGMPVSNCGVLFATAIGWGSAARVPTSKCSGIACVVWHLQLFSCKSKNKFGQVGWGSRNSRQKCYAPDDLCSSRVRSYRGAPVNVTRSASIA